MRILSKSDFMDRVNADYGLGLREKEELPVDMIDRVTAGVESDKEESNNKTSKKEKSMSNTTVESEFNLEEFEDILNRRQLISVKATIGQIPLTQANVEELKGVKGISKDNKESKESPLNV